MIGGVACLLAPIPFLFYRYGGKIRQRSKFAPTGDARPGPKTEEKPAERPSWRGEQSSSEDEAVDEEKGAKDLEKQLSSDSAAAPRHDGDPYLDADGIEKAER